MKEGFTYILLCADGSYYTGSTVDLYRRLEQHQAGEGANHTAKRLPVKLVYYEHYQRIDQAFYREKQIQGWSRKKKEALINGEPQLLPELAMAYRDIKGGFECLSPHTTVKSLSPHTTVKSLSPHTTVKILSPQTTVNNGSPEGKINNMLKNKPLPIPIPKPEALEGEAHIKKTIKKKLKPEALEGEAQKKVGLRPEAQKKVGLRPEALEGQNKKFKQKAQGNPNIK